MSVVCTLPSPSLPMLRGQTGRTTGKALVRIHTTYYYLLLHFPFSWLNLGAASLAFAPSGRSILAASSSDGHVWTVRVQCSLKEGDVGGKFAPSFEFHSDDVATPEFIDKRGITAIQWINLDEDKHVRLHAFMMIHYILNRYSI